MIYAYYRVSTYKQDYESQKIGVIDYCKRNNYEIDKEILDNGVSGRVKAKDRKLGKLLKQIKPGDMIITSELSRLGRSTADVINTCNIIADKGAYCYFVKQSMSIDNTPLGKMLIAIFSAFAEMERDLIIQRTKEAMARRRAMGKYVGRKPGAKNLHHKLDGKEKKLHTMLIKGMSRREIAKKLRVSPTTVNKFIKSKSLLANLRSDGLIINQ